MAKRDLLRLNEEHLRYWSPLQCNLSRREEVRMHVPSREKCGKVRDMAMRLLDVDLYMKHRTPRWMFCLSEGEQYHPVGRDNLHSGDHG